MNRRVRGLLRKEFLQVLRDPSSIAIAFLMPALLLLLSATVSQWMPGMSPWVW